MNPLFVAIFEDGTKFEGGDYINTKWMEIPNKKIRTMGYRLPNGDWLMLHKYEEYFHMVEVTTDIIGDERKSKIEYIYIMGKRKGIVKAYKIDIRNGIEESKNYDEQDNFIKGLNPKIWKQGVI